MTIQLPSLEQMLTHEQMWRMIEPSIKTKAHIVFDVPVFVTSGEKPPSYAFQDHPHFETYQNILELFTGFEKAQAMPILGPVIQTSRPLQTRKDLQERSEDLQKPWWMRLEASIEEPAIVELASAFGQAMKTIEEIQERNPEVEITLGNMRNYQTQQMRDEHTRRRFDTLRRNYSESLFASALYGTLRTLTTTRHLPIKSVPQIDSEDNILLNELGNELYRLSINYLLNRELTKFEAERVSITVDEMILRIGEKTMREKDGISYDSRQVIKQSAYIARLIDSFGTRHPAIMLLSRLGQNHMQDRDFNQYWLTLAVEKSAEFFPE